MSRNENFGDSNLEQDIGGVHVRSHSKLASHLLSNEQLICTMKVHVSESLGLFCIQNPISTSQVELLLKAS